MSLPRFLVSPPVLPFTLQGRNCPLPHSPTKAPTSRFTPSEVYGCHPARRRGSKALTGADTGLHGFGW